MALVSGPMADASVDGVWLPCEGRAEGYPGGNGLRLEGECRLKSRHLNQLVVEFIVRIAVRVIESSARKRHEL